MKCNGFTIHFMPLAPSPLMWKGFCVRLAASMCPVKCFFYSQPFITSEWPYEALMDLILQLHVYQVFCKCMWDFMVPSVFPVWMFQWPNFDMISWTMKLCFWYLSRQSVHHNIKHHIHPQIIPGGGTSCLLKLQNCIVLFHFSVSQIVPQNHGEHDQNCVSLCILICSPKILLYFHWRKMGYEARGYSFSVQPLILRPLKI